MSVWFTAILTGFGLGVLGNMHCVAMCGPLALSLPVYQLNTFNKLVAIFFYNIGRMFSYTLLGVIFGFIGKSFSIFGLQQFLSIISGVVLLLLTFSSISSKYTFVFIDTFKHVVQRKLSLLLSNHTNGFAFISIGFLNGLLPCGLVYIAITTSLAMCNVYFAALLMMAFGLGTFPLMIILMLLGNRISVELRHKFKKVIPAFVCLTACLLILRGLNLNIPYVSPHQNIQVASKTISCH